MDCTFHRRRFPTESITRPINEFYENKQKGGYYKVCIRCRKRIKHLKDGPVKTRREPTEDERYLHIMVDGEIYSAVKRIAKLKGYTMSYYVQEILREQVFDDILELARAG